MKRDETISTVHAQYLCTFRPEKGGGYTVRCAAFPELVSNGRTLDEARHNAREALELCLEVYQEIRPAGRRLQCTRATCLNATYATFSSNQVSRAKSF
jgi:predicted RNase H-like HicB family nuclease